MHGSVRADTSETIYVRNVRAACDTCHCTAVCLPLDCLRLPGTTILYHYYYYYLRVILYRALGGIGVFHKVDGVCVPFVRSISERFHGPVKFEHGSNDSIVFVFFHKSPTQQSRTTIYRRTDMTRPVAGRKTPFDGFLEISTKKNLSIHVVNLANITLANSQYVMCVYIFYFWIRSLKSI